MATSIYCQWWDFSCETIVGGHATYTHKYRCFCADEYGNWVLTGSPYDYASSLVASGFDAVFPSAMSNDDATAAGLSPVPCDTPVWPWCLECSDDSGCFWICATADQITALSEKLCFAGTSRSFRAATPTEAAEHPCAPPEPKKLWLCPSGKFPLKDGKFIVCNGQPESSSASSSGSGTVDYVFECATECDPATTPDALLFDFHWTGAAPTGPFGIIFPDGSMTFTNCGDFLNTCVWGWYAFVRAGGATLAILYTIGVNSGGVQFSSVVLWMSVVDGTDTWCELSAHAYDAGAYVGLAFAGGTLPSGVCFASDSVVDMTFYDGFGNIIGTGTLRAA